MRLRNDFRGLDRGLFLLLAAAFIIQAQPAMAQNFCGPNTLVSFSGTNGQYPVSGVTFDNHGNMFGTTAQGGASFNPLGPGALNNGLGTMWRYTPGAGLTSLFSFSGATTPTNNGYHPLGSLSIDAEGNLFGTTEFGGNDFTPDLNNHFGLGTIFEFSASAQFTTLRKFSGPDGMNPVAMLRDAQANLIGVTSQGGADWNPALGDFGLGAVFQLAPNGTFTNPVLLTQQNSGGGMITGGLVGDGLGNYYGTTYQGGSSGKGSIFKFSASSGLTTLFNFNGTNGMLPSATPILDSQGNLYGTAFQGGAFSGPSDSCCGTIWKYSTVTGQFTTLVSFDGETVPADGMFPSGGVVLDAAGNLYGGTLFGGAFGDGIIYEYSAAGQLSTLATFSGPNGWNPLGDLTFDAAGDLYGVTNQGGASGFGTVFQLTPNTGGPCGGVTVSSVSFNPANVPDGSTSQGTVTLSAAAPAGGAIVGLQSDNSFGVVPATVTIAAGSTSATFSFFAQPGVLSNTPVIVTASIGNSTVQGSATITPVSSVFVSSVSLNPASVTAGSNVNGTVTLNKAAPSGGAVISLSSSNTSVATVPSTVTIQSGKTNASFQVRTQSVRSSSTATISGTFGGVTKASTLTVTPKN